MTVPKPGQTEQSLVLKQEDGIAMMTVLMLTVILTVIGVAAITSTSLDIKMAGGERVRESSVNAAEACMSSGVQIIQQTLANGAVPATLSRRWRTGPFPLRSPASAPTRPSRSRWGRRLGRTRCRRRSWGSRMATRTARILR